MLHARVIGIATATVKHRSLSGWRLLIVQPYAADNQTPDGEPLLALDKYAAGAGSVVVITSDGRTAKELVGEETTPVRWTVIGIKDK